MPPVTIKRTARVRWVIAFVFVVALLSLIVDLVPFAASARAQVRGAGGAAPDAKVAAEQCHVQQAKAWELFYAGKYEDSAGIVQPLTNCPLDTIGIEATHLLARCGWASGRKPARAEAQKLWKELEKKSTAAATSIRLVTAKALVLEDQGKNDAAIEALDAALHRKVTNTCTAEAAIELARLYAKAKRVDDATHALDFVEGFLEQQTKIEMSPAEAAPFLAAAKSARNQLKYLGNEGLAEFEKAETVRQAGQFKEAAALYHAIVTKFPDTDFSPRSELNVGHCLLGLKRPQDAVQQWKKFVASAPAGPWRGQAFVALIDLSLEEALDLNEAARQVELASGSVLPALANENASASWKSAALDVYLRLGTVRMVQGRNGDAAEAWEQARKLAAADAAPGVDALVAAARTNRPVLPADVSVEKDPKAPDAAKKASLVLALGTIQNLAGHGDKADALFGRLLPDRTRKQTLTGATPAQVAFAYFGRANTLYGKNNAAEAKASFQSSVKEFAAGSWHDETLYCLGFLIQQAQAASPAPMAPPSAPADAGKPDQGEKVKALTAAELERRMTAEREQQTKMLAARGEALPYWNDLLKRYPNSPRAWAAYYNTGALLWETKRWNEAAEVFNKFVTTYPRHPLAGEAYIHLMDMALENTFSLKAAETASATAVQWVEQNVGKEQPDLTLDISNPWRATALHERQPDVKVAAYEIYLRAAVVAYLEQKNEQAIEFLAKGKDFDVSSRAKSGVETGLSRMTEIAQGKQKPLMPDALLPLLKDERQKTGIILADLYLMTFNTEKAGDLYQRLLVGNSPFPKPQPPVEAYLLLRVGQSLEFQRKHDEAMLYLKRLYAPEYAQYPWTADGIFRVGTWTHNSTQNPRDAMQHWQHVFTHTPNHPEAERSLFYFALSAERMKEYAKAIQSYQEYVKRYPQGRWTKRIEKELLPEAQQKLADGQQGKEKQR